eukprot:7064456-Heterocapsa_arctica.AAC.1
MMKGRSSSIKLNCHCRRGCAIELAGNLTVFDFWVASAKNPADAPSRVFGGRQPKVHLPQPLPRSVCRIHTPTSWARREHLVLLLCSGPRRDGDIGYYIELHSFDAGLPIRVIAVDPC